MNGREANHSIALAGALLGCGQAKMDPWVLGYWLANGSVGDPEVTCDVNDSEYVMQGFAAAGYFLAREAHDSKSRGVILVTVSPQSKMEQRDGLPR